MDPHRGVVHLNDIAWVASTLAAEQRRRGMAVEVIELPKPGASLSFPWKLTTVPLRVVLAGAVVSRIRSARPGLVHVHYATQAFVAPASGRPYLVHCHGTDIRGVDPASPRGRILAFLMRHARAVLYSTPDLRSDAERLRPDASYLPNPIDTATFTPTGEPNRDVLLAIRLDPVKGGETAIRALATLLEARPATTATVVAYGGLAPLARELLGSRVRYLGPVPHGAMAALLREHRVAIGQLRLGALGQLELEAMATGLPVVMNVHATGDSAMPPVLPAASVRDVAGQLARVLDGPDQQRALAAACRAWVVAHHAVERVVDVLEQIYDRATERHVP